MTIEQLKDILDRWMNSGSLKDEEIASIVMIIVNNEMDGLTLTNLINEAIVIEEEKEEGEE